MGKQVTQQNATDEEHKNGEKDNNNKLLYRIDDDPPWLLAMLLGFQVIYFIRAHF